jgi:hypothetical protein
MANKKVINTIKARLLSDLCLKNLKQSVICKTSATGKLKTLAEIHKALVCP